MVKTIYMIFFLAFVGHVVIQLNKTTEFRPNFKAFFHLLIVYTMVVLVVNYIYQFSFIFKEIDFVVEHQEFLEQMGLVDGKRTRIALLDLLLPLAILLIAIKIQSDYFRPYFIGFSDDFLNAPYSESKDDNLFIKLWVKFRLLLRLHLDKIWLLTVCLTIIDRVSLVNFILLLLLIFSCFAQRKSVKLWFKAIIFTLSSIYIVAQLTYQTTAIYKYFNWTVDCGSSSNQSFTWTSSPAEWCGFIVFQVR
ncbi:MAG: hypothetical protein AAF901_13555 [Bacteroidota bacterium]